jgi:hypothetical protein
MSRPVLSEILNLSWAQQANYLQGQSKKDLEILWFQIQRYSEGVNQLRLAVFSILRDLYEGTAQGKVKPERGLHSTQTGL